MVRTTWGSSGRGLPLRLREIRRISHTGRELQAQLISRDRLRASDVEDPAIPLFQQLEDESARSCSINGVPLLMYGKCNGLTRSPLLVEGAQDGIRAWIGSEADCQGDSYHDGGGPQRQNRFFRLSFSLAIHADRADWVVLSVAMLLAVEYGGCRSEQQSGVAGSASVGDVLGTMEIDRLCFIEKLLASVYIGNS